MFATRLTVSIPQLCHEDWNSMTAHEQGKFCRSCHKTVTDFTSMSDSEVATWLAEQRGQSCGRFREDQLNTDFSQSSYFVRQWHLKTILFGLAT